MFDMSAPLDFDDELVSGLKELGTKLQPEENAPEISQQILDSATDDLGEKQFRSDAMAIALTWVEEGDYSVSALAALVSGVADVDGDNDISESEEELYADLMKMAADSFLSLGGNEANIKAVIESEDDDAAIKLGAYLSKRLDDTTKDDDTLIAEYAVKKSLIMDSTQRVVRDGKVVLKKIPLRKKRLSAAQRAALKKARKKAHSAAARRSRAKSMRTRKSRGL